MRTITLTKGYVTVVDEQDHAHLSTFAWWALENPSGIVYAVRSARRWEAAKGLPRNIYMHRVICGVVLSPEIHVDHLDHNGLNNRGENLRPCTVTQNSANRRVSKGSSKYKGVYFDKDRGLWMAKIGIGKKYQNLGRFISEEDAAKAYDRAALLEWGEFALLNFCSALDDSTEVGHTIC